MISDQLKEIALAARANRMIEIEPKIDKLYNDIISDCKKQALLGKMSMIENFIKEEAIDVVDEVMKRLISDGLEVEGYKDLFVNRYANIFISWGK